MKKAYWPTLPINSLETSISSLHLALLYKGICLDDSTVSTVLLRMTQFFKAILKVFNKLLLPDPFSSSNLSAAAAEKVLGSLF